jgi:hypothetical protein
MENNSLLRFVAKGVGGFFAFLAPFLAASTYFGGGAVGVAISTILALGAVLGLIATWPRLTINQSDQKSSQEIVLNEPCASGPYKVNPGKPTKIPLRIREGDTVDGHIAEVGSYHFNWFLLDEGNLIHFLNDERFIPLRSESEVAASKLQFKVPNDGPWFLLLDASGKQNPREVEIHLRTL